MEMITRLFRCCYLLYYVLYFNNSRYTTFGYFHDSRQQHKTTSMLLSNNSLLYRSSFKKGSTHYHLKNSNILRGGDIVSDGTDDSDDDNDKDNHDPSDHVENSLSVQEGGECIDESGQIHKQQEEEEKEMAVDDERYSRQVYSIGPKAHHRIRSSTVYLDGPYHSGLVYECAKNLALSGIKNLIIIVNDDDDNETKDTHQHIYDNAMLDDLGSTYQRGARSELEGDNNQSELSTINLDPKHILVHYLQRLNPNIVVSTINLSKLLNHEDSNSIDNDNENNAVLLCMDRPYSTQVYLNEHIARPRKWKFVAVETYGLYGRIFCDFGSNPFEVYDPDGEIPLSIPLYKVVPIETVSDKDQSTKSNLVEDMKLNEFIVHCIDDEKHDVSKGDMIEFQYRTGEKVKQLCMVTEVYTPYRVRVQLLPSHTPDNMDDGDNDTKTIESDSDITKFITDVNENVSSFQRIKTPQYLEFSTLSTSMNAILKNEQPSSSTLFAACDLEKSFDQTRKIACTLCFQVLSIFITKYERYPNVNDLKTFQTLLRDFCETYVQQDSTYLVNHVTKGTTHIRNFLYSCAAKFTPIQCIFGAIATQETIKAITGLYYPVKQFLLYDCDEVINNVPKLKNKKKRMMNEEIDNDNDIHNVPGLTYILGRRVVRRLRKQRIFVVGAGAIGCELLKNLASMGVGTRKDGKVIVTDMDTIEKSNLSRQFLFRDSDIGKFKSFAARDATNRFLPDMKLVTHSCKVGEIDNTPFDDNFWSKEMDIILNALDNVEARLFMDTKCVENKKFLIDAGTMGPKGNVQVVVPDQSESYSSSVDPPEPAIPVCTLKNFPYAIAHTIQWARSLFNDLYEKRPDQTNKYLEQLVSMDLHTIAKQYIEEKGDDSAFEIASEIRQDLDILKSTEDCDDTFIRDAALQWAGKLSYELFYEASMKLIEKHPLDSVDEDGEKFWTGTRRPPKAVMYNPYPKSSDDVVVNENIISFVRNAARLKTEVLLGCRNSTVEIRFTEEEIQNFLRSSSFLSSQKVDDETNDSPLSRVHTVLSIDVDKSKKMTSMEFEKDDESNGHVAFVTAASNLRAICYGIPPVDVMETRRVAGRIVPAMITTTAFVSALSSLELVKVVQKAELKSYRNSFINLALPFFAFTRPLPAESTPGLHGKAYTLWDRFTIKESQKEAGAGGITLSLLLRKLRSLASSDPEEVIISSISYGPYMLYADFLHQGNNELLESSLWKLVKESVESGLSFSNEFSRDNQDQGLMENQNYLDLFVVVSDAETGEEVELPSIRLDRYLES